MKKNKILKLWIIVSIGFGNLLLIFGTHLIDSWFDTYNNAGFTIFGVKIPNNLIIDLLYALIFILQFILMYFILDVEIKKMIKLMIKNENK